MAAVALLDQAIALIDGLLGNGSAAPAAPAPAAAPAAAPAVAAAKPAAAPKEPKAKAAKAPAPAAAPAATGSEDDALFGKVLIKVARITSCEPLANSEKLYKLRIDLGAGESRQVCAGLQQYLRVEQLQDQLVCVVANLKPAKLAGEPSEAMVLAADTEADGKTVVRTLIPPAGAAPGDVVFLEGGAPSAAPDKVLKSDAWKKIGAQLAVKGGKAAFNGRPLVTAGGAVTLPAEIPEGAEIH